MHIESTIEYKFNYQTKKEGLDGTVILAIHSLKRDQDSRLHYRVYIKTVGPMFQKAPMYVVSAKRPMPMNYVMDYRATSLYKMLREHCHLVSIEPPRVIDLNQVFHRIKPEDYLDYIRGFTGVDGEPLTRDNFTIPPSRIVEKIRMKSALHPAATLSFV